MLTDLLQGSLERSTDQRGAERHVLRLAAALDAPSGQAITVHNLSHTGLLLASDMPLAKGEEIVVELADGARHRAEVVWADERLFGCRFAAPLSRASLSAALLRAAPSDASDHWQESRSESSGPTCPPPGALTRRTKISVIGSAALACWACLVSAVYLVAE